MALVSLIDKIFNLDFSRRFEIIQAKNVTYNRDVYPYTLKDFVDKFRRKEFGRPTQIGIVLGTTRHSPSDCKHAGYVSDALYIPEIIQKFQKINGEIIFESFLDIDVSENILGEYNFILCGDGEVNYIVKRLLDFTGDVVEIKYDESDKPFFMKKTSRVKHHIYGVVHVLRNPWNGHKFILNLGGIGPIGTIASLRWLSDKLDDPSLLPSSPFAVVKGEERRYPTELNGYENHCEYCCKVAEEIQGEEKIYWRGKISNVTTTPIQVYPK